jgi:hypothetical protein
VVRQFLVGILAALRVFRLLEIGMAEPRRDVDVVQIGRHALVRLGSAVERDEVADLLHRGEARAIGNRFHEFVEQVHHLRAVGLQLLDDVLARDQVGARLVEFLDFLDLLVERRDLALEVVVAALLVVDDVLHPHHRDEEDEQRADGGRQQHHVELAFALLAPVGAPGQEVDVGHQSKLLSASPQAIMSAGASCISD